uniref:Transient receptor potential cation channel subfamily A member 1 homolog n=1 Tax=Phallusia mammillata TaxID=59560 RepID=A0A6F9DW63_9ASCI|nr:transient receptor potential cation channel subfamily A member 1 homolog [Phallusia mammillata]
MCKLLVEQGSGVDVCGQNGESVLHMALKEETHNNSEPTGEETSENAINEIVEYLLGQGACVDLVDIEGCTPLHYAALHGNVQSAKLLISGEEPIQKYKTLMKQDRAGKTSLHIASEYGHVGVAKLLIEAGFQSQTDDDGLPCNLQLSTEVAIENEFDVNLGGSLHDKTHLNMKDNIGYTSLHYAAQNKHVEMCKLLVEHGAGNTCC